MSGQSQPVAAILSRMSPETVEAAAGGAPLSLDVRRGRAGLAGLRGEWEKLVATLTTTHCFHEPDWHDAYLEALAEKPDDLYFAVVRRAGTLVAICPFQRTTRLGARGGMRVLEIPWHAHTIYTDAIGEPSPAVGSALAWMLMNLARKAGVRWDVLRCENFLADSALAAALNAMPAWRVSRTDGPSCDTLACCTFAETKERVSKNFRGNLRKAQNKLEKLSGVELVIARTASELPAALDSFLSVEASGWKGTAGTGSAIRLDARLTAFYRGLLERFARRDAAEVHLLRGDGQVLAGDICLHAGGTAYMLKVGYDEAHAALAPGGMLLGRVLEDYLRRGRASTVNLMTDAAWHGNWKPTPLPTASAWVFNTTARGLAARAVLAARQRWQRFRTPATAEVIETGSARNEQLDRESES